MVWIVLLRCMSLEQSLYAVMQAGGRLVIVNCTQGVSR